MTGIETWSVFAITETALCLTPGPAVLFVVSQGLRYGGARSLWANAGILAGNAFYFVVSATGLGAVLLASHRLFLVIKWAGAVYLVFLGIRAILERGVLSRLPADDIEREGIPGFRLLARGFATQVANPKALVFFTALLPQFLNAAEPILPQLLLLGITGEVIEFLVLGGYGLLSSSAGRLAREPRFGLLTNRLSGTFLIAAGTGLALTSTE